MVKKVLTLVLGLVLGIGAMAQYGNPTVPQSDIQFWTGTGSNRAVIAVTWNDATAGNIGIAWGVQWNGSNVTIGSLMDTIAAYDSRMTVSGNTSSFITNFSYVDSELGLNLVGPSGWWWYNWKAADGSSHSSSGVAGDVAVNGDFVDWLPMDEDTFESYPADTMIMASDPNAGTATNYPFPESNVLFWAGSGSNSAVVSIGFDGTCLVYGVRWNGNLHVSNIMDTINTYDSRLSISGISSCYISEMNYSDPSTSTAYTEMGMGWMYKVNGSMASGICSQNIADGDYVFFSDDFNFTADSYVYVTDPNNTPVDTTNIPVDATIAAGDILYWVGEGSNHVILAVNWADTALAWGYRFGTENVTVQTVMEGIQASDPRFSFSGDSWLTDINFVEDGDTLGALTPGWWMSTLNGNSNASMGMSTTLANNDFFKWGDYAVGVTVDTVTYAMVFPATVYPVSVPDTAVTPVPPTPVDATIAAGDILYWVGEGSNHVILAVNWADTALAWGYRFGTENVTVQTVIEGIQASDPRFSFSGDSWLTDINFVEDGDTLGALTPGWWMSTLNGNSNASMGMSTTLANNDFFKWGDYAVGVTVDTVTYAMVFPATIYPVSVPEGPFCGAVDTEGCDAIAADSSIIIGWATTCTVVRGPVDITNPNGPRVHYGEDSMGVGPATTSTTEAVSLGDGGTATLTFAHPIRNGEGPDFAVFENSFNDNFLELAFVEVSTDGERFVRFPATSLTQTMTQVVNYVDPTFINNLAGKYRVGYGTPFDLEELRDSTGINIDSIVYVRLVDVVGIIDPQYATYDAFGHIVNDPWPTSDTIWGSGGFDLTGVAVMYENTNVPGPTAIDDVTMDQHITVYPNPATERITITTEQPVEAELYDLLGSKVMNISLSAPSTVVSLDGIPAGIYVLRAGNSVHKIAIR